MVPEQKPREVTVAFCVVYRVGGTDRFEWKRAGPYMAKSQAEAAREKLLRAGYHALYPQDWTQSHRMGLPEGYSYTESQ
jgi:hypothetical protein